MPPHLFTNFENDIKKNTNSCRQGVIVFAEGGSIQVTNTHFICAERRLLNLLEYEAKINGNKGAKKMRWIRKYTGGIIRIWRYTADGNYGKVFPCSFCRKSLENLGLKVLCPMGPDKMFYGYMTNENKEHSKLTTGQRLVIKKTNKFPINTYFHS